MILGITVEKGWPDDKYPAYFTCKCDCYRKEIGELSDGQHPLTNNSLKIIEYYNLIERLDKTILYYESYFPLFKKKIYELKKMKKLILKLIKILLKTSEIVNVDTFMSSLEGNLEFPINTCEKFFYVETYDSIVSRKIALKDAKEEYEYIKSIKHL